MVEANKLGRRVCKYREQLGLTQEQLAVNSGLDLELIKDVEEGRTYPPVGLLIKISRALGQRLGTFMDDQFHPDPVVVRKSSRKEEASSIETVRSSRSSSSPAAVSACSSSSFNK